MKILLIIPKWSFTMPWVSQMAKMATDSGHEFAVSDTIQKRPDIAIFGWMNKESVSQINNLPKHCPYIVFMRRYEFYTNHWRDAHFEKIDQIYCVNSYIMDEMKDLIRDEAKVDLLYNGVDLSKWTFRKRDHGRNIAMVGFINPRKNIPLALQIMNRLPRTYQLHTVGEVQCGETLAYMTNFARANRLRIIMNDALPGKYMDKWLDDKDYLLCCATSEGNPNNVLECMAKGIKPVIHTWPGSETQFNKSMRFYTVDEAVQMISHMPYRSDEYRELVENNHSSGNYDVLMNRILELTKGNWESEECLVEGSPTTNVKVDA